MANLEHLTLLKQGNDAWNEWHESRYMRVAPGARPAPPDLSGAILRGFEFKRMDLTDVNFDGADLSGASFKIATLSRAKLRRANLCDADLTLCDLDGADLCGADLRGANLEGVSCRYANLQGANLKGANLRKADLERSYFRDVNLSGADLSEAYLGEANLLGAQFQGTLLSGTDFTSVFFGGNVFADVDLSVARRIGTATHCYASSIGMDTLYRSKGEIPEVFLRGCGVPESLLAQAKALVEAEARLPLESCCICHHPKDEEFARRLQHRMQKENIRVWLAPHVRQAGRTVPEQMDEMIQKHDKLVMVLSPNSMGDEWVKTELNKVREAEIKKGHRKLHAVGHLELITLMRWRYADEKGWEGSKWKPWDYVIPDFTQWQDAEAFEAGFSLLLQDLQKNEKAAAYDPEERTERQRACCSFPPKERMVRKLILADEAEGTGEIVES